MAGRHRTEALTLSLKVWIARGSLISIASLIEFVSRFARTAFLSRLLTPSEFGTTAAISVLVATAGLVTDVAIEKFVIVRPDEDRALAAVHLISLIRGGLLALLLIIGASTFAAFFGVPQYTASFGFVALVPFVRAFAHQGIVQAQRSQNYVPGAITNVLAQVAAFVSALAAAYVLRDHRAILVSFITESLVFCLASHLFAQRPYKLEFDRSVFSAALSYGLPLLVNGIGLALYSQLDRILVGHWFGVSTLALYAIILNLTVVPISLIHRVFGTLGLSYIASRMKGGSVLRDDHLALVFIWSGVAALYALFVAATFDWLTPLVFGSHYRVDLMVHILITVLSFAQVIKGAPINLLLATGRTARLSALTLSSGMGLPFAYILTRWWPSYEAVLFCIVIGDLLSCALFFFATTAWLRSPRYAVLFDIISAFGSLIMIVLLLGFKPELTVETRGAIISIGLLTVIVQMTFGIRQHAALKAFLFQAPNNIKFK